MNAKPEVPQATLDRIALAVRAVAGGAVSLQQAADAMRASPRHAAYALSAARVLDLLYIDSEDALVLSALGEGLAESLPSSADELRVLAQAVRRSETLKRIAPGLLDQPRPSLEELVRAIQAEAKLSRSTATHRARMLLRWREILSRSEAEDVQLPTRGMWRRLIVSNYRSIANAKLDISPFTLVVGPNGSGKSNLADVLVFARDIAIDAAAAIESRGGIVGVRRWRPTKPTLVTIEVRAAATEEFLDSNYVSHRFRIQSGRAGEWFFQEELIEVVARGRQKVAIERSRDSILKSTGGRIPRINSTASAMIVANQLREFRGLQPLAAVRRYRLDPHAMRQPQFSTERTRLDENGANIAVVLRNLKRTSGIDELLEVMRKVIPGLIDISVEQIDRYLALKFSQRQSKDEIADFSASEMSEGALRALGIVTATLQMLPDELLIVEEPEVSIHVGAAALLFDVLKSASERGAVLVTTHSADLLDAAKGEDILVCEYRDGITRIGPLANAQRDIVREGLFSLAELMRSEPLRLMDGVDEPTHESDG